MKGTIKRLVTEKNFGFITPDGADKDVFFHASSLAAGLNFTDLQVGDVVTFETEESEKGPRAVNVNRA
jgi:CspA family cold shock protein